ncbi:hypothetical protein ACFY04_36980 [Streptomyces sp. NPDC001549]|uniref:hypothetical protein n=1 Tax=Streptomyces sp. NPDC001549 TaxID=3364586 RepID=UPI00367B385B
MNFRYVMGGFGLVCAAWGGYLLLQQPEPLRIAAWLGGAVVVHDGLVAPVVMAIAALVAAVAGPRLHGVMRGALIVAGSLTAIALPPLLRPGGVANPTVLPLDYLRNWLLALAAIALYTLAHVGVRAVARRVGRESRESRRA